MRSYINKRRLHPPDSQRHSVQRTQMTPPHVGQGLMVQGRRMHKLREPRSTPGGASTVWSNTIQIMLCGTLFLNTTPHPFVSSIKSLRVR